LIEMTQPRVGETRKGQVDVKFYTYYLPQFHVIPENEAWHGKGFTEWTKVKSSIPLYDSHIQPRVPHPDIGYYSLEDEATLYTQARLMEEYGIDAQIFYHYWFSGKLILEKPAQSLLSNPDIRMPFAFCWANENWTRRWDGGDGQILLGQTYSNSDAENFIKYLIPFFQDDRYEKIDGHPVLLILRTSLIPNLSEIVSIWNGILIENGIQELYLLAVHIGEDPRIWGAGFQALIQRPLYNFRELRNMQELKRTDIGESHTGYVWPYSDVSKHYTRELSNLQHFEIPSVVVSWDVSPRHGKNSLILHGGTPGQYRDWLVAASLRAAHLQPRHPMVFINAWNEWAEGAYLEPDSANGYKYLEATSQARTQIRMRSLD